MRLEADAGGDGGGVAESGADEAAEARHPRLERRVGVVAGVGGGHRPATSAGVRGASGFEAVEGGGERVEIVRRHARVGEGSGVGSTSGCRKSGSALGEKGVAVGGGAGAGDAEGFEVRRLAVVKGAEGRAEVAHEATGGLFVAAQRVGGGGAGAPACIAGFVGGLGGVGEGKALSEAFGGVAAAGGKGSGLGIGLDGSNQGALATEGFGDAAVVGATR